MEIADPLRWSADCDYFTATMHKHCAPADKARWVKAINAAGRSRDRPEPPQPWAWMGYHGLTYDRISWGERKDGSIVRASSDEAAVLWRLMPLERVKVTRFDVALTMYLPLYVERFAHSAVGEAVKQRDLMPPGRRRKVRLQAGFGDGDTLYLGARTSSEYGRLYDKWKESRDDYYKWAWRAEVELKPPASDAVFRYFREVENAPMAMAQYARTWFDKRGVKIPFDVGGFCGCPYKAIRKHSNDVKRLAWLSSQVAPCVRALIDTVGREEVELALGLRESL